MQFGVEESRRRERGGVKVGSVEHTLLGFRSVSCWRDTPSLVVAWTLTTPAGGAAGALARLVCECCDCGRFAGCGVEFKRPLIYTAVQSTRGCAQRQPRGRRRQSASQNLIVCHNLQPWRVMPMARAAAPSRRTTSRLCAPAKGSLQHESERLHSALDARWVVLGEVMMTESCWLTCRTSWWRARLHGKACPGSPLLQFHLHPLLGMVEKCKRCARTGRSGIWGHWHHLCPLAQPRARHHRDRPPGTRPCTGWGPRRDHARGRAYRPQPMPTALTRQCGVRTQISDPAMSGLSSAGVHLPGVACRGAGAGHDITQAAPGDEMGPQDHPAALSPPPLAPSSP